MKKAKIIRSLLEGKFEITDSKKVEQSIRGHICNLEKRGK